jgi:hypothetical protein
MVDKNFDPEDDAPDDRGGVHKEFECPDCNAHNPYDDGFRAGDEIQCFYCGTEFKVLQGDGRLRFKAV